MPNAKELSPKKVAILCSAILASGFLGVGDILAGPLHDAARDGNLTNVEQLVLDGHEMDVVEGFGAPLHWAALNGHLDVVSTLLSHGANVNVFSAQLGTPLHAAVWKQNLDVIELLLAAEANTDIGNGRGFTPLMLAAFDGSEDVVALMIKLGVDVNEVGIVDGGGLVGSGPSTALHFSIQQGETSIMEMLRNAGAEAVPPADATDILANADASRGAELVSLLCAECHPITADDTAKDYYYAGPSLFDIVGKPVASQDWEYTPAMREYGGVWTPDRLFAMGLQPMLTVPGSRMIGTVEYDPEKVADVVRYLISQSPE